MVTSANPSIAMFPCGAWSDAIVCLSIKFPFTLQICQMTALPPISHLPITWNMPQCSVILSRFDLFTDMDPKPSMVK